MISLTVFVCLTPIKCFAEEYGKGDIVLSVKSSTQFTEIITSETDELYTNNSEFEIFNFEQLNNFARSVDEGVTFYGKTINLKDNIIFTEQREQFKPIGSYFKDTTGWHHFLEMYSKMPKFCGTFDGNGYIISGLEINPDQHRDETEDDFGSVYWYEMWDEDILGNYTKEFSLSIKGFFNVLGDNATVKNLHLDNFYVGHEKTECNWAMLGTICGLAYGENITIENCKVTNGITICDRYYLRKYGTDCNIDEEQVAIAGICAVGTLDIRNCYVENFSASYVSSYNGCDDGGVAHIGPVKYEITNSRFEDDDDLIFEHSFGLSTVMNCIAAGYDYQFLNYDLHENEELIYPEELEFVNLILERADGNGDGDTDDNFIDDNTAEDYYLTNCDFPISAVANDNCFYIIKDSVYDQEGYGLGCYNSDRTTFDGGNPGVGEAVKGSSVGGKTYNDGTEDYFWYYANGYMSAYPHLRYYMEWDTINFMAVSNGSVSAESILIPKGVTPTADTSTATLNVLDQLIEAIPNEGYEFAAWKYSSANKTYQAMFVRISTTLNFANAVGVRDGDTIEPSGYSFQIYGNEPITVSHIKGEGPITLKYKFKNTLGKECEVDYLIPYKYNLRNSNNPQSITTETTITPEVEIKKFEVTLKAAAGSDVTTDTKWIVEYGESIVFNRLNLRFTFNGETVKYTPNYGYKLESLLIKQNGITVQEDALTEIIANIEIELSFVKWHTVTFNTIANTTAPTNTKTLQVKENDTISLVVSSDNKMLTYSYNGKYISYEASKFYILNNGDNELKITNTHSDTITPITTFYACEVTIGNISTEMGTRVITGDDYEVLNDCIFAVEFGTEVDFSIQLLANGLYKYVYTFSSGEIVSFNTTNNKYAMKFILNEDGVKVGISNGLNGNMDDKFTFSEGISSKEINPIFALKLYNVELK